MTAGSSPVTTTTATTTAASTEPEEQTMGTAPSSGTARATTTKDSDSTAMTTGTKGDSEAVAAAPDDKVSEKDPVEESIAAEGQAIVTTTTEAVEVEEVKNGSPSEDASTEVKEAPTDASTEVKEAPADTSAKNADESPTPAPLECVAAEEDSNKESTTTTAQPSNDAKLSEVASIHKEFVAGKTDSTTATTAATAVTDKVKDDAVDAAARNDDNGSGKTPDPASSATTTASKTIKRGRQLLKKTSTATAATKASRVALKSSPLMKRPPKVAGKDEAQRAGSNKSSQKARQLPLSGATGKDDDEEDEGEDDEKSASAAAEDEEETETSHKKEKEEASEVEDAGEATSSDSEKEEDEEAADNQEKSVQSTKEDLSEKTEEEVTASPGNNNYTNSMATAFISVPTCLLKRNPDGTWSKPRGRPKTGYYWDGENAVWVPTTARVNKNLLKNSVNNKSSSNGESKGTADDVKKEAAATPGASTHSSSNHVSKPSNIIALQQKKRMTTDGCIVPKGTITKLDDGTYKRPRGIAPAGFAWDCHRGVWVPSDAKEQNGAHPTENAGVKGEANLLLQSVSTAEDVPSLHVVHASSVPYGLKKRVDSEGCIVPRNGVVMLDDGTYKRPRGIAPKGFAWDCHRGVWVPEANAPDVGSTEKKSSNEKKTSRTDDAEEDEESEDSEEEKSEAEAEPDAMSVEQASVNAEESEEDDSADEDEDVPATQPKGQHGCIEPKGTLTLLRDGTLGRPRGGAPKGYVWDGVRGVWVPSAQRSATAADDDDDEEEEEEGTKSTADHKGDVKIKVEEDADAHTDSKPMTVAIQPGLKKRVSTDGCIFPRAPVAMLEDGTYKRPRGIAPKGFTWDILRGVWMPHDGDELAGGSNHEVAVRSLPPTLQKRIGPDGCIIPKGPVAMLDDGTYKRPRGGAPYGFTWDPTRGVWMPGEEGDAKLSAPKSESVQSKPSDSEDSDDSSYSGSQTKGPVSKKRPAPPTETKEEPKKARVEYTYVACNKCEGCKTSSNCGSCLPCMQLDEFLGDEAFRPTCVKRICTAPVRRRDGKEKSSPARENEVIDENASGNTVLKQAAARKESEEVPIDSEKQEATRGEGKKSVDSTPEPMEVAHDDAKNDQAEHSGG